MGRVLGIIFVSILVIKRHNLFDTRGILSTPACDSCTTENNRQSNKKEILKNNQDKKYNSMKHLKGQQFLFRKTCKLVLVSLKVLSHE